MGAHVQRQLKAVLRDTPEMLAEVREAYVFTEATRQHITEAAGTITYGVIAISRKELGEAHDVHDGRTGSQRSSQSSRTVNSSRTHTTERWCSLVSARTRRQHDRHMHT
jgi:hypothetical protein